ncbi:MAG: pre-peptidase C-terminal domain-containing protein, partial [Bacteroidota bacterium]
MKYLLLYPLLILCGNSLQGQVTNDNRYNLFVQVVGTKYNPDNQNGTNYVTFLIDAAVDNNNTSDWLHNTSTGSGYSHSITWNYDTPETRTDTKFYKTILNATNAADFEYDVSFMAFENDCGSRTTFDECCGFLCLGGADLNRSNYRSFWNTKYQNETGQFYYRWINSNQSKQIRLRHAWRYYNGESRLRPLTFGQVPDNQWRYHTNYNRRNPSGASSRLGYYNNWVNSAHPDLSESPDVTYTFSIASTRQVTIKTTSSTTNYDTRLHLARKTGNGNDDWELISSSGDLSSTNNKSFIQEVLEAGTYYVVVEGDGNAQGRFRLALFSQVPSFAAGSITHPEPWVRDGCTLTRPIESVVPASTPFGTLNLQWQRRPGGASTWTDIAGATSIELTGAEAGAISSDMDYRRRATVGTDIKYSNIVSIHAVPESRINGSISGRVQGKNGNGVVPGVTVYAIANPPVHGECPDIAYSGVTNSNGQFVISDMYYGVDTANTIYSLVAKFEDHKFDPDTLVLPGEMKSTFRNFVDQIILDTTTIFINGTITQTDATSIGQTTCSSEGINFYLQRESDPPIFQAEITDENGNFGIPLPSVGDYTIIPDFREHPDSMNHRFDKMDSSFTNVVDDIDNADFENLERHTLSGALHACGDYRFAGAKLLIEDDPGCFRFIIETDANGNFSKELPARPYLVSFLDTAKYLEDGYLAEDLIAYFNQPVEVDLSWDDALLDLNYRQEPVIEYTGLSTNACGDIILEQGQAVSVIFDITESNTEGCVMDTGVLVINDMISDRDQLELPISNGRVEYTLIPGEPNFSGDFTKTMTVEARHIERPELRKVMTVDVIVEGFKQREASFTTVSPQIPLIILRDPPGDMSYAYLNEQETTEIASEFFTRKGGTVSVWQKAKVGAKFEAGFLGFSTESHFRGSIENE